MNVDIISRQLDFNQLYAKELIQDVNEEDMSHCPTAGLENHPAFTIGHLTVARSMMIKYLGGHTDIPNRWINLFHRQGPGDPTLPESDSSKYPSKSQLLDEFAKQHNGFKKIISTISLESFQVEAKWRFSEYLPTKLDCILFMCLNHESMHLGQLSAWRRAMSLPSALGRL